MQTICGRQDMTIVIFSYVIGGSSCEDDILLNVDLVKMQILSMQNRTHTETGLWE